MSSFLPPCLCIFSCPWCYYIFFLRVMLVNRVLLNNFILLFTSSGCNNSRSISDNSSCTRLPTTSYCISITCGMIYYLCRKHAERCIAFVENEEVTLIYYSFRQLRMTALRLLDLCKRLRMSLLLC